MTSGCGGRKFLVPRIMKEPAGRYSPVGADLDTCRALTAHFAHVAMHPGRDFNEQIVVDHAWLTYYGFFETTSGHAPGKGPYKQLTVHQAQFGHRDLFQTQPRPAVLPHADMTEPCMCRWSASSCARARYEI